MPDLNKYLAYLLVTSNASTDTTARSSAGVMLKNNILKSYQSQAPETLEYVKAQILQGLVAQEQMIRNISGNVITTLVTRAGIGGWPEILPQLMTMAEGSDVQSAEGAMSALSKICEDSAADLDKLYNGARPLEYMIPKFLQFMENQSAKVRALSVACINQFVTLRSQSVLPHIDAFLNALFNLATRDEFVDTRCNVCVAFVGVLSVKANALEPYLEGVVDFSLFCVKSDDERLAKEGCEFILHLAESEDIDEKLVAPHLKKIVPTILSTMVYSEMDQMLLQSLVEDDENVEDKAQDIRPNIAKSKKHEFSAAHSAEDHNNSDSDSFDDEDEDDDAEAEAMLSEWNLRKCSAAALDVFSTKYPELVLEYSMPYLRDGIVSGEWSTREAAILAFGAISSGCYELVGPHLPELIPFLVRTLKDSVPAVRQITCWTLGRYSSWIAYTSSGGAQHEAYLQPVLEGILGCCLDKNKKVQEAACSALSMLSEEAGKELLPYLDIILSQLAVCFTKFHSKNLQSLCETLSSLLESLGSEKVATRDPAKLLQTIMPSFLNKWNNTSDEDRDIWPLFECMSTVASEFGTAFAPYARDVYTRGVNVVSEILIQDQNCQNDMTLDPPDKEFAIAALEMLNGVALGLKGELSQLIQQTQPPLAELILACFDDELFDLRQSAFALLGDLSRHNVGVLSPYLPSIITQCIEHMDMAFGPGVCNNAIWSSGEITLALGEGIQPYAEDLFKRWVNILDDPDVVASVSENAAIAIGRLAQALPSLVSAHLGVFIKKWCYYIRDVLESNEKESAYVGLCQAVSANRKALDNEALLIAFVDCIASYEQPSPKLQAEARKVLSGYKELMGMDWDNLVRRTSTAAQIGVQDRYGPL